LNRSPGARRKAKAPPPPSSTSSSSSQQVPQEQNNNNPIEAAISEPTNSNQYLTGNDDPNDKEKKGTKVLTSKSLEESSPQSNQFKNIYKRFTKGFSSLAFFVNYSSKQMTLLLSLVMSCSMYHK
jgi:hypothetical protein